CARLGFIVVAPTTLIPVDLDSW
nr:immunoglobulin heavy chain junction region [Macaca mulatta]MOW25587.1 immunoglobulin heavy chain junction region [Macaca mulatta]MOW26539.1 immunoglobulin heavy chain junction region [Macaca mulatta]